MPDQSPRIIDADTVETFQREGVVLLKGIFKSWMAPLTQGIDELIAHPSQYGLARTVTPTDGSAPFFQDYCNWSRIQSFKDFVYCSPAAEVAAQLMGSNTARFFHEHTLVKYPGNSTITPWHHDQPYYCVEGRQNVSLWIPLDPVDHTISLRCIRGSHLWKDEFSPTRFNGTKLYEHKNFKEIPDIDAHIEDYDIVSWSMEPGDAIAFSFRTVHGASGNHSMQPRRVFSARWVGDDAQFADRGGITSPPFPELTLKQGDPLISPLFPQIWPNKEVA
ncbi:phytanoyl-CoA dioxygenase family protein [Rosenbergiella australiborealis]|uniref:phytanoyl-CoA dioxygenase family protein n=1 Tax=Rosenbergiella australiborealis TaxID=1544696 RepID=UPI001F4D8F04|nr:phytanoyl-CoA dioxygenase family protein [Rosenbergiella australiborealis]